ncbi:MAG: AAA family ATPase [Pirellulaceae bacterium]
MNWLELELIAFGPFAGQTLDFSKSPHGLHLVYGKNEAGKSSTLRALRCFLYGFPRATGDDQNHEAKALRIGGRIQDNQGQVFHWIRRRGVKNSLRESDDLTPVNPDRMLALLGGIDEDQFCSRFGLHYDDLVTGGRAIATGQGELGQLVFSAASGLAGLSKVQRELDEEADSLYRPLARKRKINQTMTRLADARKSVREVTLSLDAYQRCELVLNEACQKSEQCAEAKRANGARQALLVRYQETLKLLPQWMGWKKKLTELDEIPYLDEGWSDQRRVTERELLMLERERDKYQVEVQQVDKEMETLGDHAVDAAHCEAAQHLIDQRSALVQATRDVASKRQEQMQLRALIDARLGDLNRRIETDDYSDWEPLPLQVQEQIALLIESYQKISAQRSTESDACHRLRHQLAATEVEATEEGLIALEPLAERLELSQDHEGLDPSIEAEKLKVEELELKLGHQAKELRFWKGSADELMELHLPHSSRIESHEEIWRELESELKRVDLELEAQDKQVAVLERELHELDDQAALPDPEQLNALREQRDQLWLKELKPNLREPTSSGDAQAAWMMHGHVYESLTQQADQLADQLLQASAELQKKKLLQDRVAAVRATRDFLKQESQDLMGRRLEWEQQWRKIWPEELEDIGDPVEMRDWISAADLWIEGNRELAQQQRNVRGAERQRDAEINRLREALENTGCKRKPDQPLQLRTWVRLGRQWHDDQRERHRDHQEREREQERLQRELAIEVARLEATEDELKDWTDQWQAAIAPLNVGLDLLPEIARKMVNALLDVEQSVSQWRKLDLEARAFESRLEHFKTEVQVTNKVFGLADCDDWMEAVEKLRDVVHDHRRSLDRLQDLELRKATLDQERVELDARNQRLHADREVLSQQARVDSSDRWSEIETLSTAKRDAFKQLQEVEQKLRELALEVDLETWSEQVASMSVTDVDLQIQELAEEEQRLERETLDASEQVGAARKTLLEMNGNAEAAAAQEEVESLTAELEQQIDTFSQLTVASAVMRGAIQAYREKHQGPILEHASRYFHMLTCGSFSGLVTDLDEQGQFVLLGQREGRQRLQISQMSEGTRDQLYLALRLASLRDQLEQQEPWPLILDDILIKFDDPRALATLEVLSELGKQTQVILFTHHAHLLDLARRHFPEETVQFHTLEESWQSRVKA